MIKMFTWLLNNIGTIVVLAVVIAIIATVIISMRKGKKSGKSSCGCGCSNCPMSGSCHSAEKNEK